MKQNVLITAADTPLGGYLTEDLITRGYSVIAVNNANIQNTETDSKVLYYSLSQPSFLAARNLMLHCYNQPLPPQQVLLVHCLDSDATPLHQLSATQIDEHVDRTIKGALFMIKESIAFFNKTKPGSIQLIIKRGATDILPPINAAIYGALTSLFRSVMTQYQNEPIQINTFETDQDSDREFAGFIVKNISNEKTNNGKWLRYEPGRGFLSGLGIAQKRKQP